MAAEKKENSPLKQRVFEVLTGGLKGSRAARLFSILIIILILGSLVSMVVESFKEIHDEFHGLLFWLETVTVMVFTLEYILGLWTADLMYPDDPHPRRRFMRSFMAVIELLAVFPFYLGLILSDPAFMSATEIFQLLRLLHLFKLAEFDSSLHTLGHVIKENARYLVLAAVTGGFLMISAAIVLYKLENPLQPDKFRNVLSCFRWALVDAAYASSDSIRPLTTIGRLCAAAVPLTLIGVVAVWVGVIATSFGHRMREIREQAKAEEKKVCPWCGHPLADHPEGENH